MLVRPRGSVSGSVSSGLSITQKKQKKTRECYISTAPAGCGMEMPSTPTLLRCHARPLKLHKTKKDKGEKDACGGHHAVKKRQKECCWVYGKDRWPSWA